MHFDLHLRSVVREQLQDITGAMRYWQIQSRIGEEEAELIRENVCCFNHSTNCKNLLVAGVDGSGVFPLVSYADSFVYLSVAQGTVYEADRLTGLKEVAPVPDPLLEFHWIPESEVEGNRAIAEALYKLAGKPLDEVIQQSDYQALKRQEIRKSDSLQELLSGLILPHASDVGNLAIQLRSTAEMGAALRLIEGDSNLRFLLVDTTFALPLVSSKTNSLFHEHLKRLCCVEACRRQIGFFALSKSHGLPAIETLEVLVRDLQGLESGKTAEHWFLRIPEVERDGWSLSLTEGRRIPPPGAVSYLVRFHRTTSVLRLDMDRRYWEQVVQGETEAETRERERQIFENLDYTCHDQRVYGYPYPVKAAHDRASLTEPERVAFRKQLIAEAVKQGMSPMLFRDPSQATGHR
ncbi:MAG: hypothetical protein WCA35_18785 [Kovacikia sp.]